MKDIPELKPLLSLIWNVSVFKKAYMPCGDCVKRLALFLAPLKAERSGCQPVDCGGSCYATSEWTYSYFNRGDHVTKHLTMVKWDGSRIQSLKTKEEIFFLFLKQQSDLDCNEIH